MFILYVLLIESAQSQSCVDADLSIRCMDRCYTVQQSCMESAFIETSKYDCYSGLTECVNACPCQKGCPNGCNQCNNSICECKTFQLHRIINSVKLNTARSIEIAYLTAKRMISSAFQTVIRTSIMV